MDEVIEELKELQELVLMGEEVDEGMDVHESMGAGPLSTPPQSSNHRIASTTTTHIHPATDSGEREMVVSFHSLV